MKTTFPKISVIIPTCNRSQLLLRSVRSVLDQTYRNIELIIVDDNSTDNTKGVIFALNDPRVNYIKLREKAGVGNARNVGIDAASGEYVGFNDDDDELDHQKLEKQITKFMSCPESVGIVYCGHRYVTEGKTLLTKIPQYKGNIFKKLLISCFIHTNTPLIKKECFDKAGIFDVKLPSAEDWDMWLRISKYFDFEYIPEVLSSYHLHSDVQISQNLKNKISGRELFMKKHHEDLSKSRIACNKHYRHLGALYAMDHQALKAKEYFLKSIQYWPLSFRSYIYLLLLFFDNTFKIHIIEKFASAQYGPHKIY